MRLHIVAHGRIGRSPEAELVTRYAGRIAWPLTISELPERDGRAPPAPPGCRTVALDETGQQLSSTALARLLGRWRDDGVRETRFLIGAANGLAEGERATADVVLSLGAATWPHLLVRAMLAEQLYRATTILAGHPYHREG